MFIVRSAQCDRLRQAADEEFVRRIATHLFKAHVESVASFSDQELTARIKQGISRARAYGMRHQSTLTVFVVAMFRSTPRFDEHPLVRRYLEDRTIGIESRMSVLLASLDDAAWEIVITETSRLT